MTTDRTLNVESALTDLEGILHALDIIRFEDAINKPGPELHALNVLIPLAVEKADALRQALWPGPQSCEPPHPAG